MSPAPVLRTSRRTALGGALIGVTLLAGCDLGSDDPGSAPEPGAGPDDPDTGLVTEVVDDLVATLTLVEAARRHGSLRRQLGELAEMHRAHLEALGSSDRPDQPGPRRSADADAALAGVRRREQRHQRLLADRAVEAQSGRLARLLASMSAAVAQQLAVPPLEKGDR